MKKRLSALTASFLFAAAIVGLGLTAACVSTGSSGSVTSTQQTIANAVEDAISIGLVPVLAKNPSYAPAAQTVSLALGAFEGATIMPADVDLFLAKVPQLSVQDRATVAGIVNAAWGVYVKRYSQQVGASTRPDVKLFLAAVSNGIASAVAAVPKP